jgi:hypothetical protein
MRELPRDLRSYVMGDVIHRDIRDGGNRVKAIREIHRETRAAQKAAGHR